MSSNDYFRQRFEEEVRTTRDALGPNFDGLDLGYVSIGFLNKVFNSKSPNRLRESLEEDVKKLNMEDVFNLEDIERLESTVRMRAPKLYSILLMINHSHRIVRLVKHDPPIDDSIFNAALKSKLSYCSEERLIEEPLLCDIAANFYKAQWRIPPRFNPGAHESFPCTLFRFPFVGAPAYKDNGSWGVVYRAKIADCHLTSDPSVPVRARPFY
ncbi:hypothetical protein DE146DRAFT_418242 [Phaeosphaeria sp. MPI-PUGE-AT-0046c]|nr:hypothetical protein DE146DRAFT_418242 [Phaeosphaeria sp. MPI-PUGE-AT-0046c]